MPPRRTPSSATLSPAAKTNSPPQASTLPDNSRLMQRAAAQPESLNPGELLTLQRAAGNRAVGALMQRVSKKGKTRIGKMESVTVGEVESWQKAGSLSDGDIDKLLGLSESEFASAVSLDAKLFTGAAATDDVSEFYQTAKTKARSKAMGEAASKAPSGPTKPPALVALNDRGIDDSDAKPFLLREGALKVNPWLPTIANDFTLRRIIILANKASTPLDDITALLTTENPHGYAVDTLLDLGVSHSYALLLAALRATVAENRLKFLELWMSYGVTSSSEIQLQRLVRFQARLRSGGAAFTVYRNDSEYVSSQDPPSRTGFLRYNFGGDIMEVHTHWNVNKHKLVSMHVQDNSANGLEINTWTWFDDVAQAVQTAHNSAPGTRAPTGGALSL